MENTNVITNIHIETSIPIYDNRRQDGEYMWVVEAIVKRQYTESPAYTKEGMGYERATTKNRLALLALDDALYTLKPKTISQVYVDNPNIMHPISEGWIYRWASDGWMRSHIKGDHKYLLPLENADLWQRIYHHLQDHPLIWAENEKSSYLSYMQTELRKNKQEIITKYYMNKREGGDI